MKKTLAVLTAVLLALSYPAAAFAEDTPELPAAFSAETASCDLTSAAGGDSLVDLYEQALSGAAGETDIYDADDLAGAENSGYEYIYRLYNPNDGQHLYTRDDNEKNVLSRAGWNYEGYAFTVLSDSERGNPVYRLYNPNNGDHHYTPSEEEVRNVVAAGWTYEGVAWYAADETGIPVYRLYNPNASVGYHHYTTSEDERDMLIAEGWLDERIGWYAVSPDEAEEKTAFGQDGATYSIQATVVLNGTRVKEDGGCIAKVVMPVNGDSAASFDVAYDYGMNNDEHTYFYLENIMSNAAEPGLKGKGYIRLQDLHYTAGTAVSIRLSWFEDEHKLEGYVNDVKVCETSTPNKAPSGFMLEGGGKYNGDTVDAEFSDIVINRRGTITSYPPFGRNCSTQAYNGLSSAFTDTGCSITGTTTIPDNLNWDTIMSYNGHATSGYCIIGM